MVTAAGHRSFVVQYRNAGRQVATPDVQSRTTGRPKPCQGEAGSAGDNRRRRPGRRSAGRAAARRLLRPRIRCSPLAEEYFARDGAALRSGRTINGSSLSGWFIRSLGARQIADIKRSDIVRAARPDRRSERPGHG